MNFESEYNYFIADDEVWIRRSLKKQIQENCAQLHYSGEAEAGEDVLQMLKHQHVDILLCDIRMNGMDGIELARRIQKDYPWVQIIIISGYNDFEYAQCALRLGVSDYLLKPIQPDKLLSSLQLTMDQLKRSDKDEITLTLSRSHNMDEDLSKEYRQCILEKKIEEASIRILEQLIEVVKPYFNRPRLLQMFLTAWSIRTLAGMDIQVTQPLSIISSNANELITAATLEHSVYQWVGLIIQEIEQQMHHTGKKSVLLIKQYIEQHYDENITLEVLADTIFLNKTYLAGVFKQETGITIGEYIREIRMIRAADILQHSRLKVSEVAQKVGYQDTSHFSKVFRAYYGSTPQAFRNLH